MLVPGASLTVRSLLPGATLAGLQGEDSSMVEQAEQSAMIRFTARKQGGKEGAPDRPGNHPSKGLMDLAHAVVDFISGTLVVLQ